MAQFYCKGFIVLMPSLEELIRKKTGNKADVCEPFCFVLLVECRVSLTVKLGIRFNSKCG